ncbi:S8/S53 family peptidase [Streptomyces ipomoeae]|uniref:S8/S53 family peptidase n=1 Tax=Streptomyces ipomoeae TaxID=103232 RepID=UPI0015F0443E|nr:S8/S53 family peptidase [Streptomyces ipomoeae]
MCEDRAEYSTVIGPQCQIWQLMERWDTLKTPGRLWIERPSVVDLRGVDPETAHRFDDESLAIAVAYHHSGLGIAAAAQLQAEAMVEPEWGSQLLWEPGYEFQSTHHADVGIPDHPFDESELALLVQSTPAVPAANRARGHRVAVLDTGLRDAHGDMLDFVRCDYAGIKTTPTADPHGHGTAVATVIKAVCGAADIHPIRVLNDKNRGKSYEVLAGLIYALWSGAYDLINASLTTDAAGPCATSLGRSIDFILRYCSEKSSLPVLVAAAGNFGRTAMCGYPARLPQAVVALAQDHTGQRAEYNSTPPDWAFTQEAYGGSKARPLGHFNHPAASLWGTSFAAAAVSGAYLP